MTKQGVEGSDKGDISALTGGFSCLDEHESRRGAGLAHDVIETLIERDLSVFGSP